MKSIRIAILLIFAFSNSSIAQKFETSIDSLHGNTKMFKGIIQKSDLLNEPTFTWYAESQRVYSRPDTSAVNALKSHKNLYFIIFGGTWCVDTHYVIPKFFKIQEAAFFPETHIAMFAVDHNKRTTGNIAEALGVDRVPTIIVMQDGKELGRTIEFGANGRWDRELAEIINTKAK